jgi:hypothetical protein
MPSRAVCELPGRGEDAITGRHARLWTIGYFETAYRREQKFYVVYRITVRKPVSVLHETAGESRLAWDSMVTTMRIFVNNRAADFINPNA